MAEETPTPDDDDAPDDEVSENEIPEDVEVPGVGIPEDVANRLEGESATTLRAVAEYATALAGARTGDDAPRETREPVAPDGTSKESSDGSEGASIRDAGVAGRERDENAALDDGERPDGVPGKASITVKEINDNRYYYWQWRDGDAVKSKYHGPVDSGS